MGTGYVLTFSNLVDSPVRWQGSVGFSTASGRFDRIVDTDAFYRPHVPHVALQTRDRGDDAGGHVAFHAALFPAGYCFVRQYVCGTVPRSAAGGAHRGGRLAGRPGRGFDDPSVPLNDSLSALHLS